jgi:DNA helicase IV
MKSSTKQADKIYDYYIKMEEIIFKYIQDQYKEQQNIIQENIKIIKENKELLENKDRELEDKTTELNNLKNQKYEEQLFQKTLFFGKVLEQK